ncbi:YigZ family protein [Amphritea sp. HPY]|uniref:YigZ family protein n=1 Tax=Amphritea sp. HPY TaxID=3421652 RepID=UPI003D7CCC5B
MTYLRPSAPASAELEIKHSRFICYISPVSGRAEADEFVRSIKRLHPKANHNCWSYIAGMPDDPHQWNSSDDGEPKGTAGQPMLNILRHSELGEICAVVTRYFGGVKLGTGGLVRAYGQSVQEALKVLEKETVIPTSALQLTTPYNLTGDIEHLISSFNVSVTERSFGEQLLIQGQIEQDKIDGFIASLTPFQHQITLKID